MKPAAKVAPNEEELKTVHDVGFKCVELYTNRNLISESHASIANIFELEYAIHAPLDLFDKRVVDFAASVGAKVVVVHNILDMETLAELVEYAKSHGITVCMENGGMLRKPINGKEFFAMQSAAPSLRMCLDTEHAMQFGAPNLIEEAGHNISHVHLTGYPPNYHSPPFENPVVVEDIIRRLRAINYSGFIVAEMDLKYQKKEIFEKTKMFMDDVLRKT